MSIPTISDYSHWNEEAEAIWYLENRYDMENPPDYEDYEPVYEDEIPEDVCFERYQHQMNDSGTMETIFGEEIYVPRECSDCGAELSVAIR